MDSLYYCKSMKVVELKAELRKHGASTTGRKDVLVERLVAIMLRQKTLRTEQVAKHPLKRGYAENISNPASKKHCASPPANLQAIQKLFQKYADIGKGEDDNEEPSTRIEVDGMLQLCEDLGVEPEDPVMIVLSQIMGAERMGVFLKSEFERGCVALSCHSIDQLRIKLPKLRERLNVSHEEFPKIYKVRQSYSEACCNSLIGLQFTFNWAREEGQRNITTPTAIALWPMLLPTHYFPLAEEWFKFLEAKGEKLKVVTKDTWNQLLEFISVVKTAGIAQYDTENDSWPVLIDEFVEWYTKQKTKDEKS